MINLDELRDHLTDYLDRKFARQDKKHNILLEQQNALLQQIVNHINPKAAEAKLGSAEEDKIDDTVGEYDRDKQAKDDIAETWKLLGYPDKFSEHLR